MIAEPRKTGLIGEITAARYLRNKNYDILAANYASKTGEIDIIACDDKYICFVEVKTRHDGGYFSPSEAVDYKKEENVKSTAAVFISSSKLTLIPRFDIIEVVITDDSCCKVRHTENAF